MNKNKVNKQEYNNQVKRKELINKIIYCVTLYSFLYVYLFFYYTVKKKIGKNFNFAFFNGFLNFKCLQYN